MGENMARKESVTIQDILEAAFEMARQEGYEAVTARKLAAKVGCSTQPIFRVYKNMEELGEDLFENAVDYFEAFYKKTPKRREVPFVDLGMIYIKFAEKEKNLFKMLFLQTDRHSKSFYEIVNGKGGYVMKEIAKAKEDGCKDPSGMFARMWILIHGAACMTITGDYDMSEAETALMLQDVYAAFKAQK